MMRAILALALAGTVTACDLGGSGGSDPAPTDTPTATASPVATATSNGARTVSEETDDFLFEYSYPAEVGEIPELAALLDARLAKQRAELARDAESARREARANGFPYN